MDGILNINKPRGVTSYGVVAAVKRLSGERRVGHAGTLDPAATGVLPVCLGRATRVVEFLADASKSYRAQIELGVTTDTYDSDGEVTGREDASGIGREELASALGSFCGSISQIPPMYSAVKHQGVPLYKLARAGVEVERRSRQAEIYRLEISDWQPPVVTIEVACSKGTYIRSLAHDLGQSLGCGASLKDLVRLRHGIFDIKDSVSVSRLEEAFRYGYWRDLVYTADFVLSHWPAVVVGDDTTRAIRNGRPVSSPEQQSTSEYCRAYTLDGCFVGVLRFDPESGQWQPRKVIL